MFNISTVIMAGGSGERFWPLSTREKPKQFLCLLGNRSLLQQTLDRLRPLVPLERILVVTGREYEGLAREQLPDLPDANLVLEPVGRDTAACIGLASLYIENRDPDAVMIALPADHYIPDQVPFLKTLEFAASVAHSGDWLITLGIKPTRPETGYGYIKAGEKLNIAIPQETGPSTPSCSDTSDFNRQSFGSGAETPGFIQGDVFLVERFVEKPDSSTARAYLAEGSYYWNSGIFIWKNRTIQAQIAHWMPGLGKALEKIREELKEGENIKMGKWKVEKVMEKEFTALEKVSIDYGVMEKAEEVLVIPAPFRWDDLGSWAALERVLEPDENGNLVLGSHLSLDTKGCIIYGKGKPVGTIGLSDMVIVQGEEGLLVCPKDRAQEVKKLARKAVKSP